MNFISKRYMFTRELAARAECSHMWYCLCWSVQCAMSTRGLLREQVNKFLENLSEGTRSVMSHYFLTSSTFQLITVKF